MSEFKTVDNIVSYLEEVSAVKYDTTLPMSELKAVAMDDNIGLQVDSRRPIEMMYGGETPPALPMSRSAFRSMFYRAGLASIWKGMRDDISPTVPEEGAALLNSIFAHEKFNSNKRGMKQMFVRSRGEIHGLNAVHRGVASERYVPFDMLDVAQVVQQQTHAFANMSNTDELMSTMRTQHGVDVTIDNGNGGGIGHRIERAYIGIDSMSFRFRYNMKFHTDELGPFYIGAFIKTDEVMGSSVHILPYIWREVCSNGMVASYERNEMKMMRDANGFSPIFPHLWGTVDDLRYKATQAMAFASGYGAQLIVKARQAAYRSVPNASEVLGRMLGALVPKDNLQQTTLIAGAGFEGQSTVMGLVNAVTAAAHTPELSQDVADTLESVGGTALRKYNEDMSDNDITNLFLRLSKVELIHSEEM